MPYPTFAEFETATRAQGFDEVLVRHWKADLVVDTHSHPFTALAQIAEGEMWLTCGSATRHLGVGDGFRLEPGEPHAERYGPAGAVFWLARRHAAPAAG